MQKSKEEMAEENRACVNYLEKIKEPDYDKCVAIAGHFKAGFYAAEDEMKFLRAQLEVAFVGNEKLYDEIKLLRAQNKLLIEQRNAEILRGTDNHEWQIAFYDKQLSALTLETSK